MQRHFSGSIGVDRLFYPATGRVTLDPYDYLNNAAIYATQHDTDIHPLSVDDFPAGVVQQPPYIDRTDDWEVTVLAPPSSTNTRGVVRWEEQRDRGDL